ncbi:hypothetical protein NQ315_016234 [Exocentrus adspersus]|uniref:DUF4806 domain-containing protein n=1 Tax=Exocentrus adspersus TaxID=1586481 RepID=A0AAV8VJ71_9CUCU|nr:hypothetical protein NQ315_016234 [Exocentrus adspersus]
MATWSIVKFLGDNSVAAVPTKWLTDQGCLWPPYTAEKTAAAIRKQEINTCWPTHQVEIFRNATLCYRPHLYFVATSDGCQETGDMAFILKSDVTRICRMVQRRVVSKRRHHDVTRHAVEYKRFHSKQWATDAGQDRNVKKAEETSDLNTDVDESKRKTKPVRKISSSSDDDNGTEALTLKPPPKFKKSRVSYSTYKTGTQGIDKDTGISVPEETVITVVGSPIRILSDTLCLQTKYGTSPNVIDSVSDISTPEKTLMPEISREPLKELRRRNVKSASSSTAAGTVLQCSCCPAHKQGEAIKSILYQHQYMRGMLTDILDELRKTSPNQVLESTESLFKEFMLPLNSEEDLTKLHNFLNVERNFTEAVREIKRIGGKDCQEIVKRSMNFFISSQLAAGYSWSGRRQKESFKDFPIVKLIIDNNFVKGYLGESKIIHNILIYRSNITIKCNYSTERC